VLNATLRPISCSSSCRFPCGIRATLIRRRKLGRFQFRRRRLSQRFQFFRHLREQPRFLGRRPQSQQRGAVSHGSTAHGSNSTASSHSSADHRKASSLHSNEQRSIRESTLRNPTRTEPPQKRTFFSFLRHPFRRPPAKPIANLRRPACFRGHCAAGCPIGQVVAGGVCVAARVRFEHNACSPFKVWSGGACLQETRFLDDCSALRRSVEQQQTRMRTAESARQNACSSGSAQECSDASSAFSSEENLYRTFQARYQQCQQHSLRGYLFPGHNRSGFGAGLMFDPMGVDWSQP